MILQISIWRFDSDMTKSESFWCVYMFDKLKNTYCSNDNNNNNNDFN